VPDYLEVIEKAKRILFGVGNRGIRVNFTVYSVKVDWWINVSILFEFGMNDQVIPYFKIKPFKPHVYELAQEKVFFFMNLCRVLLNLAMSIICLISSVKMAMAGI